MTTEGGDEFVAESDLAEAVERARAAGEPTLILVESESGMAGSVLDLIPSTSQPLHRAIACEPTKAKVGGIADQLQLDTLGRAAVVVECTQWADPTSLGRLQRLMADGAAPFIVLAHEPLAPEDAWWLEKLAVAALSRGSVIRTRVQEVSDTEMEPITDDADRDLVLATTLVAQPIGVPIAAQLLGVDEAEALRRAEGLVARRFLAETRNGFTATAAGRMVDVGEARRGRLATRLANVLEEFGEDPGVVGSLQMAAGDAAAAYPKLRGAAAAAQERGASGEAFHLASAALSAAEEASSGSPGELGDLHLVCGRYLRAAGRSEAAEEHLDAAVSLLEGTELIDALGFAAAVADDRQHPQDAERILAMAEWEAVSQGELAKLGSLASFRAKALNRIGFAAESDVVLSKAMTTIEEHAAPIQQFFARQNRAWILFDRGEMARAELEFTHLRDHTDSTDLAGLADKEAWRARALFGTGRPAEAMAAVDEARRLAEQAEVQAPLFLADLALTEGGLLYGRPEDALQAADRVWDLVERQLPAWRNVVRSSRARALLALGRHDEAAEEVRAALEATPAGSNGWRWRSRCHAIEIEVDAAAGGGFRKREAEDLADLFLQSEYYGWAAELTCVIAEQIDDDEAAREAMVLALQVGNPMLAARAAHAGDLWKESGTAPVIRAIRATEQRLPDDWDDEWRQLPQVAAALAAPEPVEDDTGAENVEVLEAALRRAGLSSADTILSPAQRRSKGLVRHRPRRRSLAQLVAAALGVVVLAGATSFAVAQMMDQDETPTTVVVEVTPDTTVPPPLTVEETQIDVPVDRLFAPGSVPDRGDNGRSGFVDVTGPRVVNGYYWIVSTADAITATPIAHGNNLLVGGSDGVFRAIDLTIGRVQWTLPPGAPIATSAGIGTASLGEGRNPGLVVVVSDDGVVRARDAISVAQGQEWSPPARLGDSIESSPVITDGVAYVATTGGVIHALDLASGNEIWRYPQAEEERLGAVTAGLALHDGILYVGTETGTLHLINVDGTLHCEAPVDGPITVNPIVVGDTAFISTGNFIKLLPAGVCEVPITESVQFLSESVVDVAPAVVGDLMYVPNQQFLNAINLNAVGTAVSSPDEVHHWSPGQVNADAKISTPPVVTRDAVYFGTESGRVYAFDADTGEFLWGFQTGNFVRASPVVIEGAVYIASGDGNIYAVGPEE